MKLKRFTLSGGPLNGQSVGYNISDEFGMRFFLINPPDCVDTYHPRQEWGPHIVSQTYLIAPDPGSKSPNAYSIGIGFPERNETEIYVVDLQDLGIVTFHVGGLGHLLPKA